MTYVGIDPGWTGAIAVIRGGGTLNVYSGGWSQVEPEEYLHAINAALSFAESPRVAIEDVWAIPAWGSKQSFAFGGSVILARLAVRMAGVPHEFVRPQVWQRAFWSAKKGHGRTKEMAARVCRELWPDFAWARGKRGEGERDAALIAEWLRRRENGTESGQ